MTTTRFRRASLRSVSRPHGDVVRIRRVTPGRGVDVRVCVRARSMIRGRFTADYTKITPYAGALAIVATGYDPGRPGRSQPQPLRRRSRRGPTHRSESLCRRATSTLARTILHFDDRFGVHRLVQRTPACGSACGRIPSVGRSCVDRVRLACTDVIFFIFMSSRLTMRRHHGKLHTLAQ
jgi:hypothetical protein